jgi:hypothetical protein
VYNLIGFGGTLDSGSVITSETPALSSTQTFTLDNFDFVGFFSTGGSFGTTGGPEGGRHPVNPYAGFKNCVKVLYNIDQKSFIPSAPGSDGNFTGTTPGGTTFTVENDVASYTSILLAPKAGDDLRVLTGEGIAGLTLASNPYQNYTARDFPAEEMPMVQIHELGHSLDLITKGRTSEASADKLADCLNRNVK